VEPFRRSDRDGWWIRYKQSSGRWRTVRGGDTKRDAYALLDRLEFQERAVNQGLIEPRQITAYERSREPIDDMLEEFRQNLKGKGCTDRHVHESIRYCKRACEAIKVKCLADLDARRFEKYLVELVESGLSFRSRNIYLIRMKTFIKWAVSRGVLQSNPLDGMKTLPEAMDRREVSRALTPAEYRRLLEVPEDPHRRLYYLFAGRCGLRWGEISRLQHRDIDLSAGWLTVRAEVSKSRRDDEMPLPADVVNAYRLLGHDGTGTGTIFEVIPSMRQFRRDLEAAGIAYVTDRGKANRKCLRKTFGTHLALAHVDLQAAAKLMRHSDPKITMRLYTDPMLLDLRGAMESLSSVELPHAGNMSVTNPLHIPEAG
jgi:integrase